MENKIDNIVSVSELTQKISSVLTDWVGFIRVRGEISNFTAHSSGHKYFTLKDSKAQISCVFWKSRQLYFTPQDGMKVIIEGNITVYAPRGNYQVDCTRIIQEGKGDLYLQFEELKAKLQEDGYFDISRKKQIPLLPFKIGISTSPTGAAVKDLLETIRQRFPLCTVYLRPTLVQGEGSANDIAQAIKDLENTPAEVIIIGRGGGSIEDLWSYNTEIVAEAIYNAKKPVISAVGHETDFTIADFVADARAATPTAAAVMVTPNTVDDISNYNENMADLIHKSATRFIESLEDKLDSIEKSYFFRLIPDKVKTYIQLTDDLDSELNSIMNTKMKFLSQSVDHLEIMCKSLYPLQPLKKGFALLKSEKNIISNEISLEKFNEISIVRLNETANAEIKKVSKNK